MDRLSEGIDMKAYEEKEFRVLKLVSMGNWHAIVIADVEVLRTLAVFGHIQISSARNEGHQVTLLPKGRHYLERLHQLSAGETQEPVWSPLSAVPEVKGFACKPSDSATALRFGWAVQPSASLRSQGCLNGGAQRP